VWNSRAIDGMRGSINASNSELLKFPVEISRSFAGRPWRVLRIDEVRVLRDHHPLLSLGKLAYLRIRRSIPGGQVEGMHGVTSGSGQPAHHSPGHLRVHHEPHGDTGWSRRVRASRAANARTASKSSRLRSS